MGYPTNGKHNWLANHAPYSISKEREANISRPSVTHVEVKPDEKFEAAPTYQVPERPHSDPDRVRIICIGAGLSGVCLAYKMKKAMRNYELVCYEKCVYLSPYSVSLYSRLQICTGMTLSEGKSIAA